MIKNDKEINKVIRYSESHVIVFYNLQPVQNELMLYLQWNSIFVQGVSARCSGPMLH